MGAVVGVGRGLGDPTFEIEIQLFVRTAHFEAPRAVDIVGPNALVSTLWLRGLFIGPQYVDSQYVAPQSPFAPTLWFQVGLVGPP